MSCEYTCTFGAENLAFKTQLRTQFSLEYLLLLWPRSLKKLVSQLRRPLQLGLCFLVPWR